MKLLTVGQIGKLKRVPLKKVYEWALQIRKKVNVFGRGWGLIIDEGDKYYRYLMPLEIVDKFPNVPETDYVERIIKKYEKAKYPDKRFSIILLGGNSLKNKSWIEKIEKKVKPVFPDTYVHYYKHWETGKEIIDFDYELNKLSEFVKDRKNYIIFAKSAGTLLTMRGVFEGAIKPDKCIFVGTPIRGVRKNDFAVDDWIQKYNIYTLYIQHKNDPVYSSDELKQYLQNNKRVGYAFMEIEGKSHDYLEYEFLTKQIKDIVYKVKITHGYVVWS
ncbi:MAG: hypothetical protein HYU80_02475 [Candidatus Blackburnbacteria bacterium]|nr:hypothetical protein [Candidatus Blackburnbacteria bacterium]